MTDEKNTTEEPLLNSNDLAFERTLLGEKRTLMAWVRTAISFISFGFTIYKLFQETSTQTGITHRLLSPGKVGMAMISTKGESCSTPRNAENNRHHYDRLWSSWIIVCPDSASDNL